MRTPNGKSLGEKRNEACRLARGEILVHWDDDDWSAPWRISYQVQQLHDQRADVCGLDRLWFYDGGQFAAWWYQYTGRRLPWLAGSSICFRRQFWERWPFPDLSEGEDTLWIAGAVGARVLPLARVDFLIARVHAGDTVPSRPTGRGGSAAILVKCARSLGPICSGSVHHWRRRSCRAFFQPVVAAPSARSRWRPFLRRTIRTKRSSS